MNLHIDPAIQTIRVAWCDLHGQIRSKSIVASELSTLIEHGIGMVGTLVLKDTSDRTAIKVFESQKLPVALGFERFTGGSNLILKLDEESAVPRLHPLPWSPNEAWLFADPHYVSGEAVPFDARWQLKQALQKLNAAGYAMRCGLEVEFHIYKIEDETESLNPDSAAWPSLPPRLSMLHAGYQLLSDAYTDRCHEPLDIVRQTALGLGLPLTSLEIEFGPSQFEAVFGVQDALKAADCMVLFTNGVRQALRRTGYLATFMCRPPFPSIMSSGWHLHQSLVDTTTGEAVKPDSRIGQHYLVGLIEHGRAMAAFAAPSVTSYERYQPNALAPQTVSWGKDCRAAMLRVLSNRIENRVGEPMANPYLYIASQIYAGLHGLKAKLAVSPENDPAAKPLPTSLGEALDALNSDTVYQMSFGKDFVRYYDYIKRFEIARYLASDDRLDWVRREYLNRF